MQILEQYLEIFEENSSQLFQDHISSFMAHIFLASIQLPFLKQIKLHKSIIWPLTFFQTFLIFWSNFTIMKNQETLFKFLQISRHSLDTESFMNQLMIMEDVYLQNQDKQAYQDEDNLASL